MRKRIILTALVCFILNCMMLGNVFAATSTDSWSYSNLNHGAYVPKSGTMTVKTYTNDSGKKRISTVVSMTFSSTNAARIKLYNSGSTSTSVHADCRGKKTYLTCDVSSKKSSTFECVHATSVTSNLPNPKYDLENDNPMSGSGTVGDAYNEESETVALGVISAKKYSMTTYWNDQRSRLTSGSGRFLCQFGMSKKGLSDYNTVITSDVIQASVSYSGKVGEL